MAQTKVLNIYWKQDSPYGSYVATDFIDVYWDDSTEAIVVKKNNITITSASYIPSTFRYAGEYETYYKLEKFIQASICNGTSLMKFERITLFPYIYAVEMQNHPTCSVSGEVCDLQFDSLPSVTNASTDTTADGSITVSASGSNGSVKYKLNGDFEYNDGSGQTSGTFSSLLKGNYLIFARDAKNCLSVISVTVGVTSSYGVLYQHEFYSIRTNKHQKTELLQKDYSGSVTEVNCEPEPITYSMGNQSDKDKFVAIKTCELNFRMTSLTDAQFQSLYTNDPEKFRLKHYIDNGSGYEAVLTTKVIPSEYSESYKSAPYDVSVIAHDGLATLEDIPFLDDDENRLTGEYKQISLIAWILKKIGLDLNIRVACNIYATGMATTAADDPLDQAYVDVLRYYLIEETPNCWDVLTWILEPYGAQIIQYDNVWNIIRVEERVNSWDYRVYNSLGVYQSNSSYNPIKDLKSSGQFDRIVWTDQSQNLKINSGFGKINLVYNLGRKSNIFTNGDFAARKYSVYQANTVADSGNIIHGTIPDITGFEVVNNGTNITKTIETIENSNVALVLTCTSAGGYLLSDTVNLKMGNTDEIKFTLKFKVSLAGNSTKTTNPRYVKVKVKITYGSYYLTDSGIWTTDDTEITYFVNKENLNKYQTLEVIAPSPASSYISGQNLNVKVYTCHEYDPEFTAIATMRAFTTTDIGNGYRTELVDNATLGNSLIHYYELRNSTAAESVPDIVRPNDYHATTNPYQWLLQAKYNSVALTTSLYIDLIKLEIINDGKLLPESHDSSKDMENENDAVLNRVIYHGSIKATGSTSYTYKLAENVGRGKEDETWKWNKSSFDISYSLPKSNFTTLVPFLANSADLLYTGYLRNASGTGFTTWARSSRSESQALEDIYKDMYSAQYNAPWQQIQGPFEGNILFKPIDTMRETMNGNKKFIPSSLTIDFKSDMYEADFMELTSTADADASEDDAVGFTTGFSLGFNA